MNTPHVALQSSTKEKLCVCYGKDMSVPTKQRSLNNEHYRSSDFPASVIAFVRITLVTCFVVDAVAFAGPASLVYNALDNA